MDNAGKSVTGCNRSAEATNARSFNRTVTTSTCSLDCQFDYATALGLCNAWLDLVLYNSSISASLINGVSA